MSKKILYLSFILTLLINFINYSTEIRGYLNDALCGVAGYPEGYKGKIDLNKNPENHALACIKMSNCANEGYGISILQNDGMYKFYKFDKKSHNLIKKEVVDKINDKFAKVPFLTLDAEIINGLVVVKKILSYNLESKSKDSTINATSPHKM